MARRHFLHRAVGTLGQWFVEAGGRGWLEPRHIALEQVQVAIPGLPAHLQGYRIGVLSDLHLGPLVSGRQVRRAAEMLARQAPDLVLIAGDLVSTEDAVPRLAEALEPVPGAFAVLGNWDHKCPGPVLRQSAARVLLNQGVLVAPDLWLAGVDDMRWGVPNLRRSLVGAPDGAVRILLAHEPDFADEVKPEHGIALQISGHSHGGQIRLPGVGAMLLPPGGRRYIAGLYKAPACQVYVSRGVGMVHLPIRFMCPPEVTVIKLVRG